MSLIRDTSVCMTLTPASGAFADADAGVGLDPKITKALLHRRLPTNARHKDRTRSSMKIKKRNEIVRHRILGATVRYLMSVGLLDGCTRLCSGKFARIGSSV
ncbi:hypothetical protein AcW1_003740 [Taiwanofungus camphoratus]|nr:hypothetical protein AcW1_003740 [Antrodia cinnamomea]